MSLDRKELEQYQARGLLRVSVPQDILDLQDDFLGECSDFLKYWGDVSIDSGCLPVELPKLAKVNRGLVGKVYKASRRFASSKRLAVHPFFVQLSAQLMGSSLVSCCHFVCVRIDLPTEDKYLLPPHQDFPYIQGSKNAVTVWMSFSDLTQEHGIPSFIYGSHKWGPLKVREFGSEAVGNSGGKSFAIAPDPRLSESSFERSTISRAEPLVFHTLLVHKSENNYSNEARITIQLRYDDLTDKDSFSRNFPEGLFLNDRLQKTYPELVVEAKEL